MPGLNLQDVRRLPVPLAPLREQRRMGKLIEQCGQRLSTLKETQLLLQCKAETVEPAILAKAFRGELVEQDPNDEPASVLLERLSAERQAAQEAPAASKRGPRQKARA